MKTWTSHDWFEAIGMSALIASLIFVGLQLKQSQEIAIAAQYQARLDAASGHYTAILQSDAGLRVIGSDVLADMLADETMPPEIKAWAQSQPVEDLAFRAVAATLFLKSHDNVYFQYQSGFLSEEAWNALRKQLQTGLDEPRSWCRAVYEDNPAIWRESYRDLIESMLYQREPAAPAEPAAGQ
ncbi:MAG TPA: hypothetical protein VLL07_07005 [Pontiella sp.]|nr:hypothetical protein [Pontiella sp.]